MSARVRTGVLPVYTVHQEASVASLRRFATAKLRWGLLSTSMPTRCAAQTAAHPVCDKSSTQGCPTAGIPKYLPARGLLLSTPPGQQPGCQPGYKQGPHPRIEAREQRVGTRTGAEQQSPGHCVQGTLAFASRGEGWGVKCRPPSLWLFSPSASPGAFLQGGAMQPWSVLTGIGVAPCSRFITHTGYGMSALVRAPMP